MAEKILACLILEILGRPADYVKKSLEIITEKMGSEQGVKIANKKMSEPKPIEKTDFFTTFGEIEAEFDNLNTLLLAVFNYMPSHVEIIKPNDFRIGNFDLSGMISEIIRKLHQYDEIAKRVLIERNILEAKLKELMDKYNVSIEELKGIPLENPLANPLVSKAKKSRADKSKKEKKKAKGKRK